MPPLSPLLLPEKSADGGSVEERLPRVKRVVTVLLVPEKTHSLAKVGEETMR
jgi:hypothetical protein